MIILFVSARSVVYPQRRTTNTSIHQKKLSSCRVRDILGAPFRSKRGAGVGYVICPILGSTSVTLATSTGAGVRSLTHSCRVEPRQTKTNRSVFVPSIFRHFFLLSLSSRAYSPHLFYPYHRHFTAYRITGLYVCRVTRTARTRTLTHGSPMYLNACPLAPRFPPLSLV